MLIDWVLRGEAEAAAYGGRKLAALSAANCRTSKNFIFTSERT
jgi:hypothetical protein